MTQRKAFSDSLSRNDSISMLLNQPLDTSGLYGDGESKIVSNFDLENIRNNQVANGNCSANFCNRLKYGFCGFGVGAVSGAVVTGSMIGGSIAGAMVGTYFGGPAGAFIGGIVGSAIVGAISGAVMGAISGYSYKGESRHALYGAISGFILGGAAGATYAWGGLFAGPAVMASVSISMAAIKTTVVATVGTGLSGALFAFLSPPKPAPRTYDPGAEFDSSYNVRSSAL
jgi:hypothetical protein